MAPALWGAMQRSMPIVSTKVAVIGGFLLLGLLAVAVWLLAGASPASAQTDDTRTTPQSESTDPAASQQPAPPAPSDSAPPPVDLQALAPEFSSFPIDLNALQPAVPPVTDVLPPALQPLVSDVSALVPAPARAPLGPVLSHAAPPLPRAGVTPRAGAQSDASPPPDPSAGAPATAGSAPHGWSAVLGHNTSELRAANSSSHEGDTPAPPSGLPSPVAAQGNLVSSSVGRDFGQSMLLFGVLAAGIFLLLGRGRRFLIEATWWLPAPWCRLIERPG
jgi:hypothetical protein